MRLLIFLIFSVVNCELQQFRAPKYEGAKSMSEHPKYREIFARKFPHISEKENDEQGRIIGGQPAELGQFPHHALMYMTIDGQSWYICNGALIHINFILTTANCIEEYNRIDVYLGLVERNPLTYQWSTVVTGRSNIIVHPERNIELFSYDIGLLRIYDAPGDLLTLSYIDIVQLPRTSQMNINLTTEIGTFSGFGRVNDSVTSLSPTLLYADAPIITNAECAESFGYYITGNNLCINTRQGISPCGGDGGGPLTVDGPLGDGPVLAGIMSFYASSSCTAGYPVVYTRVTHFVEWISSVIDPPSNDNCRCECHCHTCPALSPETTTDFWRE